MKGKRREPKLAAKIDRADLKQRATTEKEIKKAKRSGKPLPRVPLIGDELSSQNEEAEDELESVGRGPH
jgi:hypothetical protein